MYQGQQEKAFRLHRFKLLSGRAYFQQAHDQHRGTGRHGLWIPPSTAQPHGHHWGLDSTTYVTLLPVSRRLHVGEEQLRARDLRPQHSTLSPPQAAGHLLEGLPSSLSQTRSFINPLAERSHSFYCDSACFGHCLPGMLLHHGVHPSNNGHSAPTSHYSWLFGITRKVHAAGQDVGSDGSSLRFPGSPNLDCPALVNTPSPHASDRLAQTTCFLHCWASPSPHWENISVRQTLPPNFVYYHRLSF